MKRNDHTPLSACPVPQGMAEYSSNKYASEDKKNGNNYRFLKLEFNKLENVENQGRLSHKAKPKEEEKK